MQLPKKFCQKRNSLTTNDGIKINKIFCEPCDELNNFKLEIKEESIQNRSTNSFSNMYNQESFIVELSNRNYTNDTLSLKDFHTDTVYIRKVTTLKLPYGIWNFHSDIWNQNTHQKFSTASFVVYLITRQLGNVHAMILHLR